MKRILAAALLAGVATSALAADLPSRKSAPMPAPVYVAPAFTWTGLYAGINGAYGWSNFRNGGGTFGSPNGGLVGGTVGYNYQIGQFVIGAEDNLDYADLTKSRSLPGAISTKSRVDAFNTAFLRGGVAFDRALFFVEGGLSSADVKNRITDPRLVGGALSQSGWENGYGVGGGLEYAFTNNITARADYVYSHLQDKTYFSGTPDVVKTGLNVSQVRTGLNYKF